MITSLVLRNFRSFDSAQVTFPPSGLVVLIGANGSGKSNLVKALQFISAISSRGLSAAVANQGGMTTILPKILRGQRFREVTVNLDYEVVIKAPGPYLKELPRPSVRHALSLKWTPTHGRYRVVEELLQFKEILGVGAALEREEAERSPRRAQKRITEDNAWAISPSIVNFLRQDKKSIQTTYEPPIDSINLQHYIHWYGLNHLRSYGVTIDTPQQLKELLQAYSNSQRPARKGDSSRSFLDGLPNTPFGWSYHWDVFRRSLAAIRRFDLQLNELRKEQDVVATGRLRGDGGLMPSAVRRLREEGRNKQWRRIRHTLSTIAPHVQDMDTNTLKTGKEYVQFIETKHGRPVESWDSSDGTLRVLAILLALETHPEKGVVIIEEPEQGLHPWAVRALLEHIRTVIIERGLQVVLTTHSQQVLEEVDPNEVIVASRTKSQGTVLKTVDEVLPLGRVERGELGRLWVKGLLGGTPSSTD